MLGGSYTALFKIDHLLMNEERMVHNGIEYEMMAAIGEGFEVLETSEFDFGYEKVAREYRITVQSFVHGSAT